MQTYFYLSLASSARLYVFLFSPSFLVFTHFFFFFEVLGHEGVSRKTRTLEQAECGSSREVIIRVHESLAAWLLPRPTTYIHIYTAAAQKQCVRNITQHTYLGRGKLHGEKELADTAEFVTVAGEFR